jgi:hypothetical protein
MALEETLSTILIATALAIPVLAILMIALPWLADRRADAILRKLDDN